MNQPAIELYKKAAEFAYTNVGKEHANSAFFQGVVMGKYTELVIQECARIVNSLEQHEGPGDCTAAEYIKDYFGVES